MLLLPWAFFFVFIIFIHIVVHELGHAIPLVYFTKQKAEIFLGSYGDKVNSVKMTMGLLDIYITKDPLKWKGGMCRPLAKSVPIKTQIIYIASGPVAALLCGLIINYLIFTIDKQGEYSRLNIYFFCSNIGLFLASAIPQDRKIVLAAGGYIYNDGYTLARLFKLKKFEIEYNKAYQLYNAGQYAEAGELFEFLFNKSINYHSIFHHAVNSYFLSKNYEKGLNFCDKASKNYSPDSDSYCGMGTLKIYNKLYTQAEKDLKQSLKLNANNIMAMNNIGYCYNVTKQFAEAIPYLDKAIELKPDFAYALNNRGHAKIKTGKINDGFKDIEKAMELNPAASYTQRNMGIYFMEIGGYEKALPFLKKARELDPDTDMLPELLAEAERFSGSAIGQ